MLYRTHGSHKPPQSLYRTEGLASTFGGPLVCAQVLVLICNIILLVLTQFPVVLIVSHTTYFYTYMYISPGRNDGGTRVDMGSIECTGQFDSRRPSGVDSGISKLGCSRYACSTTLVQHD
eukprot:jgi/Botrbrau1/15303/Bobra.0096s0006.1